MKVFPEGKEVLLHFFLQSGQDLIYLLIYPNHLVYCSIGGCQMVDLQLFKEERVEFHTLVKERLVLGQLLRF